MVCADGDCGCGAGGGGGLAAGGEVLLCWRKRNVAGQRGTQRQVEVFLRGGGSVLSTARRTASLLLVILSTARRTASLLLSLATSRLVMQGADEEKDHLERVWRGDCVPAACAMPGGIVLEDEDRSRRSYQISSAALASARLDLSESC